MIEETPISCGIRVLHGLADYYEAKDAVDEVQNLLLQPREYGFQRQFSQVIFSDVVGEEESDFDEHLTGKKLARYIRARPQLGTIHSAPTLVNRNTDNKIKTWIWNINARWSRRT